MIRSIDLLIESRNESATKIATAKTSVTLDLTKDGNIVRGKSDFSFTDSFGNSGNGSISVCENVITIVIDELVDLGRGWSIGNATGDYIFKSDSLIGGALFYYTEVCIVDFIGTKAMAEIWGCNQSQITKWCREGKISGAEQDKKGSPWRIPVDALKPEK